VDGTPILIAVDSDGIVLADDPPALSPAGDVVSGGRAGSERRTPPRPKVRRLDRQPSIVATAVPQPVEATYVPSVRGPAAAAAPPAEPGAGGAAGATRSKPSKPRAPTRAPVPYAPFGFGSDLATGAAAHGSSSSLSGFALLLGALLFATPGLTRWLRVEVESRPRALRSGRPERPG